MKIIVHRMVDCSLCNKCMKLLSYWNMSYDVICDEPKQDRPYPYITFEYEYEELVDMIAKGGIK